MSVPSWQPPAPPGAMVDVWLSDGVLSRRVAALALDIVAIIAIIALLFALFALIGATTFGLGMPLFHVLPLVPPLYHFLFLACPLSATPGQAALGLIVRRNADFARPDVVAALISVIGFYVTLALGAVWLAVAFFTTRRRTLHDLAAGLVVVRLRRLAEIAGGR